MTSLLIPEDGSGLADANAYVTFDECVSYCMARGLTFAASPSVPGEQAIIRATSAIDAQYGGRFPGYKVNGREQSLQWPRGQAYDSTLEPIPDDEVPDEVKSATCEAAVRELATPGSMMPDLARGGSVEMLKAGSVEIKYGANADPNTSYQLIDGILAPILATGSGGGLFGKAVRG